MNNQEIELKAIDNYVNNMKFLKEHSPQLHRKLLVLDEALNSGVIKSKFELEYRNNEYFDILDVEKNSWFYGINSLEHAKSITKDIDLDATKNSFKTFYEFHYEDGVMEKVKNVSILSSVVFGNAPIVDYINNNSPEQRILKQIFCYLIFGVGLGFHLPLIKKNIGAKFYLIIEPQLEIFRLSLFTINYEELNIGNQLMFFIGNDKETFALRFREFHDKAYLYNQYIKFFLFSKTSEIYFEQIQSMLSSQGHTMFSYERMLYSMAQTAEYVQNGFNFMKVNARMNLKLANNAPYLMLAGGPSFKKNIEFVKKNQDKFIIVTILSLVVILEEYGIQPDIITNYDDSEVFIDIVYKKLKNENYFDDKIIILSSHVNRKFVSLLPKDNIYFFNALFSSKKDYGAVTGPSIGEMTYALSLIFSPNELYLLGLDLAHDPETGKSHFEGYNEESQFSVDRDASIEKFSLRRNVMKLKGNLRDEVETTAVYYISIKQFDVFTKMYNPDKKTIVYNLSDGAYLKDVIPLEIKDFNTSKYMDIDKTNLKDEIRDLLSNFSSKQFSEEDIIVNKEKFEDANKLKEKCNNILLSIKHSSIDEYLIALENLDAEFSKSEYKCGDLNSAILNFFRYNLPYIFYFFNLKGIKNPKSHIKKINKNLSNKLEKIIDFYLRMIEENLKEENKIEKKH